MDKVKITLVALVLASVALNIFLEVKLLSVGREMQSLKESYQLNSRVVAFMDIFITKVLKAKGEISFEDRLKIENAVRATQDQAILDQWQKFVDAKDEVQGREEIKNLLSLMVSKITYNK